MGDAEGNVGYSAPRDPRDAWAMREQWCKSIGIDAERLVTVRQVHGASVGIARATDAGRGARPGSEPLGYADALITREPGVALSTLHADCMPILLADPVRRVVASIHAGWRGTTQDVAGATVAAMREGWGCNPRDLLAFMAPSIGGCCYEVGPEVVQAWQMCAGEDADRAIHPRNGRWHFDLRAANQFLLSRSGLVIDQIDDCGICTSCAGEEWFSHRGQGPATGRFAAIIALQGSEDGEQGD
jgi:YfiH family protein